jgi:protein AbiQ
MERAMSPFFLYLDTYGKDNMRFYKVESDYLNYLRLYEPRIPYTYYGDYHYKPFLGILFKTDDLNYITHLTSYKPEKHDQIPDDSPYLFKIFNKEGYPVSVVNLAAMFPVPDSELHVVDLNHLEEVRDFHNVEEKYKLRNLMLMQLDNIDQINVSDYAKDLYSRKIIFNDNWLCKKCVPFAKLNERAMEWTHEMNNCIGDDLIR